MSPSTAGILLPLFLVLPVSPSGATSPLDARLDIEYLIGRVTYLHGGTDKRTICPAHQSAMQIVAGESVPIRFSGNCYGEVQLIAGNDPWQLKIDMSEYAGKRKVSLGTSDVVLTSDNPLKLFWPDMENARCVLHIRARNDSFPNASDTNKPLRPTRSR